VVLGRTGLEVSVMGLGGGGESRLGLRRDNDGDAVRLVRAALDRGINFIDTAEAYGTEAAIGKAIRDVRRDTVVLSTKKTTFTDDLIDPEGVVRSLEASLEKLGTDYVDIYHLHGVRPAAYVDLRERIVPVLLRLREQGKIRFLGITEAFAVDPAHAMLERALLDDLFDVVMVGFNILNQSARRTVFPLAIERRVGTLVMFAVRRAFSRRDRLHEFLAQLAARGDFPPSLVAYGLDFLLDDGYASSLADAAYRFCRYKPGVHVVLSGTGNPAHLGENMVSLSKPPLPAGHRERLVDLFRYVDDVSGQ
jgi:aryl-alcohol dehydrogenase-like predicted oxidoreductase